MKGCYSASVCEGRLCLVPRRLKNLLGTVYLESSPAHRVDHIAMRKILDLDELVKELTITY